MSVMSNIWLDIQQMIDQGHSFIYISNYLDIPVEWVVEVASTMDPYEPA